MAVLILPLVAYALYNSYPPSNFTEKNALIYTDEAYLPETLRYATREQSFSGQDHTSVRAPFNPGNPNWPKIVADGDMLESRGFRESYQMNIRAVTIETEDHRLDDQFFTNKNVMGTYHSGGEPQSFQNLNDFWHKRIGKRQKWPQNQEHGTN